MREICSHSYVEIKNLCLLKTRYSGNSDRGHGTRDHIKFWGNSIRWNGLLGIMLSRESCKNPMNNYSQRCLL